MSRSAIELIRALEDQGIRLEAVEDRLRVDAPKGRLTPELRQTLLANKPLIMSALKIDWAADARAVISRLPDESVRVLLNDYFEETAATLEYQQGLSRQAAEQNAFGLLVFQLLRRGIDVEVADAPDQA